MRAFAIDVRRVGLIAEDTIREVARQRLFAGFVIGAAGLVAGAHVLRDFNFGAPELVFLVDCGFGALTMFGAVLAIVLPAQCLAGDGERRVAQTILAGPVHRGDFVIGKYLGIVALIGLFCAALTMILAALVWLRQGELSGAAIGAREPDFDLSWFARHAVLQWMKLSLLAAVVLWLATLAPGPLGATVAGFLVFLVGHLQPVAEQIYRRSGTLAAESVGRVIGVFPDFQLFAERLPGNPELATTDFFRVASYAAGYIAAGCALAIHCFRRREF